MVFILPLLLITACREDADRNWTTPEASFKLHDTTLGATVLYPSMENNPYILTWDKVSGAASYSVVVSSTADFATKAVLGTSATNTLNATIGELNMAMLQAGISPYAPKTAYVRVENGSAVSNAISFTVTPYPVSVPVITKPTAGQSIVLDAANPLVTATTVTWTDYTYGVNVNYNVEIAPKGSSAFASAGSTLNIKEIAWTNFALNNAVLKAGLPVGVSSEVDVRVTATTTSVGGTISKVSDIVTFKVTPYQPAYVKFHLVGGGTAVGWNASGAQVLNNVNEISEIYTYLNNEGEFRFLGQQDWGPINYSLNADGINGDYKYFNTWSDNLVPSGGENMKFTGNSGMYKITINQNSRSITVTPSSVPTLPTDVYLVGSIQGWNAGAAIPMTQVGDGVFEHIIVIPDGAEFKFLGQQGWSGMEWGNIHAGGNSGFLGPNGDNNNIQFNGGGNTYKITANIKLGTYTLTPQ
ncbi:MAG: SusE domain-containing protein [Kaistella sp.]